MSPVLPFLCVCFSNTTSPRRGEVPVEGVQAGDLPIHPMLTTTWRSRLREEAGLLTFRMR